ncbi:MAG: hypothetical protein CL492_17645 [Acinetobacter sp.]|nr:hypothetical protein [Acinetobacter sp.]
MRINYQKRIEFFFKKLLGLPETYLLKRRAKRYFKKITEKEIRILDKLVDGSKASIDIGVYRGVYSYFLSNLCEYVYAFEANPLLYSKLVNGFKNKKNIKIENLAISSDSGETELRIPIRDITASFDNEEKYKLGTATIHKENNLENEKFDTLKSIKKICLDDYDFNHQIGFLKIDVEGHEMDILRGAKKLIAQNMPIMLIEIEERHSGVQPNDAINEIEQLGYSCYFVDENFTLQVNKSSKDLKNNNFIFIPN